MKYCNESQKIPTSYVAIIMFCNKVPSLVSLMKTIRYRHRETLVKYRLYHKKEHINALL